MKTSSSLIYSGLFIILLGFGDDKGKLLPFWVAFLIGGLALIYGTLLQYKMDDKIFSIAKDWRPTWGKLPPKVYILIGILSMRMNRFVDYIDENFEINVFFSIVGGLCALYGMKLHFKEKRQKRENGNIE